MKKYKPKKWFLYTRLMLTFLIIFTFGRTTKVIYSELTSENNSDNKKISQAVILDNKEELFVEENPVLTKYTSLPEKGFVVTNDNMKYTLSEEDYNLFIAIIASESHTNKDDVLAVLSVVLNRTDGSGLTPLDVLMRPGQFEGYFGGYYQRYLNADGTLAPSTMVVQEVAADALNGVRNNKYYNFRAWSISRYSDNYIVYGGNRFN